MTIDAMNERALILGHIARIVCKKAAKYMSWSTQDIAEIIDAISRGDHHHVTPAAPAPVDDLGED